MSAPKGGEGRTTTIWLPAGLWERLKIKAVEERTTLRDLVVRAAEAYLGGGGR